MGLSKTNSMSSGTDIKDSDVKIKNRWGRKAQRKSPNNVNVSSNSIIQLPLHRRIYYQWDEFIFKAKRRMRWMLNMMGETPAVLTTVISLSIASAVTTGLATWQCSPPDTIPTIDSNFWSTVASAAIGIAGLYCTFVVQLSHCCGSCCCLPFSDKGKLSAVICLCGRSVGDNTADYPGCCDEDPGGCSED